MFRFVISKKFKTIFTKLTNCKSVVTGVLYINIYYNRLNMSPARTTFNNVCARGNKCLFQMLTIVAGWKGVLLVLGLQIATTNAVTFCDPNDASTCRFGGSCTAVSSIPQMLSHGYLPSQYVCLCPKLTCSLMRPDPICASDGRTYVNDLCRELQECEIQAPLARNCNGFCGRQCNPIADNAYDDRCPAPYNNYCSQNGLCRSRRGVSSGPLQVYCLCFTGYAGFRCKEKTPRAVNETRPCQPSQEETLNYKLAFLCCLGFLVLVLLLQIICCVCDFRLPIRKQDCGKKLNFCEQYATSRTDCSRDVESNSQDRTKK
uniref:uncharacterized protein LOC100176959 isoform X2 n=1 Tax=Ciona intestinalis TaxID=7719 RepID=UPI00089DBD95|nr:uncharacterized protein LOC100176959 isoform X2 [Ciona intestinalis]|eukprot:XP_018671272.1 uncharacterized protein LOC100176959 isoform X2 [Ciona intestinalis]